MTPFSRTARAGFSLIELLAVIVILGILMAFLVSTMGGQQDVVKEKLTRTGIEQLAADIGAYEREMGRYPISAWNEEWGALPNRVNLGIEALVVQLYGKARGGTHLDEDKLVNLDGDDAKQALTVFPRKDLFEVADAWGNPLAYFERRSYGETHVYFTESPETGDEIQSSAKAVESSKTGGYHNSSRFQLLSAGPDGEFGTDDDIGNFDD